ncbi:PfkB family carbohydrate kinase [Paraburkholderia terrae]|jgi:sugar/nucleoside kinase (ribokinase family)|uniref:PfkB family carbohydrate kinase n=1 Tax=Paraburkholderia terrae TaxID=311230 RepID=UPI001EE2A6F0|nr:PfkB family carbohydrate kinase [Paraburkholderia terrae]GJH06101.1 sugar kinase [Paraburkholderia terrae]
MTQAVPRLIHTGQVLVDLVMRVSALPAPGGDVLASDAKFEVGGGFNVMAAARRSGMAVVYAAGHGSGRFGDMARAALAAEQIDAPAPRSASLDTGICVALVDATAERTFATHLGAETELDRTVLDALAVTARDIVYVSGYSLCVAGKSATLIDWIEALPSDARIAFDPGPLVNSIDPALLVRVMRRTSIWTSNCGEALAYTTSGTPDAALALIAQQLHPDALTIVRDGARGCLVMTEGVVHRVAGFAVEPIDSNGAGDAHTGVLLASLADYLSPVDAARRANAAAAIAVTRYGPATAPRREEIDALIGE